MIRNKGAHARARARVRTHAGGHDEQHTAIDLPVVGCWPEMGGGMETGEQLAMATPVAKNASATALGMPSATGHTPRNGITTTLAQQPRTGLAVAAAVSVLLIASLVVAVVMAPHEEHKNFVFYLLPARAWEMLLGSVVAFDREYRFLAPLAKPALAAELVSWAGLIMIGSSYFLFTDTIDYPSFPTLLPCVGTALFTVSQEEHRTSCGKFLAHGIPVFVGQMSYSLYLWHWPVYVLLAYTSVGYDLGSTGKVLGIVVSAVAGVVSFVVVEPAFRSHKRSCT